MIDQEDKVVGEITEKLVNKLSPAAKFKKIIKNVGLFIITFKWFLELLRLIGKGLTKSADNNRRAVKMSITDKYDEGNVWVTVFWIKYRWTLIGLIGGILLQYYFDLFTMMEDFFDIITNVFII